MESIPRGWLVSEHAATLVAYPTQPMSKTCTACGVTTIDPEAPVPPKGSGVAMQPPDAEAPVPPKGSGAATTASGTEKCPNCGKAGTMEETADVPSGEDEE